MPEQWRADLPPCPLRLVLDRLDHKTRRRINDLAEVRARW